MEPLVKNLYKAAKKNDEFNLAIRKVDTGWKYPSFYQFSHNDELLRIAMAAVYMGWLVGRDEYTESDYE